MPTAPTLLIVDDTLAGRETLRALLGSSPYRLEFAANGPEALAAAAILVPDLISPPEDALHVLDSLHLVAERLDALF